MPNNNVAILSIMSKFDEKSAREAANRANKVYDEALSDIGNVNFDKKLLDNFDKAMNLLKNKFKKVNLSSYTNNLLDSIFSDKDIAEKSKDIEFFIKKIDLLKKASSGQDINAFNTFSAKQIEALISRTEKLAQKQDEINEKTREYNREATKIAKTNRSISTIDKNYGNQDYTKTLESLKKSLGTEKEFTAEQNQSIENLAKMVNLYQTMEKSEPQKGTAEAIRYSKDLLAVTQKIKEERDKIDAFSQKGASTYIANNGLSSIDKVSDYTVNKSKDDFVKASLSNLKTQEAKLQSELTTYISDSVQKNLAKVSKEADAVIDKAEKRVENLQNKIESLQTKSTKTGSDNSIIGGIISETDIKSLEEIKDRLYAISDLDAEGEATKQQLKEYIQLYKQYEQLIASDSTVKFDSGLKDEYDFIVESDNKLKKYADTLDETITKQKELNVVKSDEYNTSVDSQTEQLVKQEEQAKETAKAEKNLSDIQDENISNIQKELEITKKEIIELSSRITNLENNSFPILSDQIKDVTNNVDTLKQKVSTLFDSFKSTKEIEALSVLIHGGNLDILNSSEYKRSDALLKNMQNIFSGTGSDYGMVTGGGIFGLNDMSGIDKTDVNPNAKWYAIDYSKYHTYMVETEQEAEELNQFMQRLNLMIVKNLGVDGKYIAPSFQDMYNDVDIDGLFLEYQQSFKGANLSLDEFKNVINEITERVKKAGFELYDDDEYSYTGKNARVSQEHAYDDDISTMFYKKHGYQGFNAQKLKDSDYNSYVYGSTIFDIDKENPYFKVFETYEEAVEYMKQVRDKIDNNQTVFYEYVEKSNGKYKEELEKTNKLLQEQSRLIDEIQRKLSNTPNIEQTSESLSKIGDVDKSNISSENSNVIGFEKQIEETKTLIDETEKLSNIQGKVISFNDFSKGISIVDEKTEETLKASSDYASDLLETAQKIISLTSKNTGFIDDNDSKEIEKLLSIYPELKDFSYNGKTLGFMEKSDIDEGWMDAFMDFSSTLPKAAEYFEMIDEFSSHLSDDGRYWGDLNKFATEYLHVDPEALDQVTELNNALNQALGTNEDYTQKYKDIGESFKEGSLNIQDAIREILQLEFPNNKIMETPDGVWVSPMKLDKTTKGFKELSNSAQDASSKVLQFPSSKFNAGQDNIQEELKETQENSTITNNSLQNDAKETAKNIHYVTNALGEVTVAYRGLRDTMAAGLSSDRYHGGTFWTDNLELAKEYSQWTKVESANLEMLNPLEIEGNGSNWNNIEWLGHNSDEASRKIIKARKDIDSLRESIKYLGYDVSKINLTDNDKSGFASYETVIDALSNRMSDVAEAAENTREYIASIKGEEFAKNYEDPILKVAIEELNLFTDAVKRYREVALDDSNTYGLFDTNKFVELAKNSGYDGVIFKNIIDSYSGDVRDISNVMVTFEQNQTHFLETISVDPVERIRANFKSVYGDISELAEKSKEEYSEIFRQMDSIETNFKNGNIDKKERANSLKKIYQENPEIPSFFNYLNQNAFATSFNEALDNSNFDEQANLILDFIRTAKNDWEALENSVSNGKLDFEKVNSLVTEFGFNDIVNDYISKIQSLPEIEKQARRGLIDFSNVDDMEKNISEIEAVYPILSKFKEQLVKISSAEEDVGEKAKLISDIYKEYLGDFNNKWNSFDTDSPIKDVFQGEAEKSGMDAIASATEEAVQSKKDFATANEGVQSSIDGSKSPLQLEAELIDQIAKSARESANAKKEFVEANKQVKNSVANTNEEKKRKNTEENTNAWKELTYSIQRYSEVSKRISSGKALEGDIEEASRLENKISQLQKLDILSPTQIEKSEQMLTKLYDSLDDIEKKSKEATLESLNSSIDKYRNDYNSRSSKPVVDNQSDQYKKLLVNYETSIKELEDYRDKIRNNPLVSKEDLNQIDELTKKVKESATAFNSLTASQKGSTPLSRGKTIEWANDLLEQNSKWSKKAKIEVQGWINKLATADPSNVEEIRNRILEVVRAEREAGNAGKTWLDIFSTKKLHSFLGQAASMFSFYDLINVGREGINTLKEFDDGLTKISYTMDMTKSQLDNLGNSVLDMASDMKSSIDDAMQVAQIYANMQTSAEEIQRLSEPTLILSNLSGFDSSTIADDIQAVTQQFDVLAEDSMHIADVYDYISRNIAVDYSKGLNAMAEGLQVAGSTAKQAGLSYEQTASIIAKAVEKTRLEGSQVGNGLKTIMTRLSKVGELSEEVDNETLSQASESLKKVGIEVYNLDGSYREFDVIMAELAGKWDTLTDAEKSNISFNIAATRQTNLLSAVLSNFSDSMQLAEEATNANGSALENQQKYMESFSGHLQSLETEAKIAWLNILDSETLKDGVDLLTGLVKVVGQLVDTFGLLGTAAGIGGIVAGFKNVGINTLVAY